MVLLIGIGIVGGPLLLMALVCGILLYGTKETAEQKTASV